MGTLKVELSSRFLSRLFLVGAFLFNKNKLAFGRRCEEGDVGGSTEEYGSEKRYTRERFFPPVVPPELNFCRSKGDADEELNGKRKELRREKGCDLDSPWKLRNAFARE
uniref:Uncharacterized protein n=1 Tax=Vespula pensylvanica TaxID=30213 RepID=A0A834P5X9_VESPE|nr:hypothetical protein H0235_006015 [Vespula pensylvanica]